MTLPIRRRSSWNDRGEDPTDEQLLEGTLIRAIGGFYTVADRDGHEYTLRCMKKFRRMHLSPLVGDEVRFTPGEGEEHGWLQEVLPRRSECVRPPVANVELLVIVAAPVPQPDLLLADRLILRARQQGIDTLLVVNKCDLDEGTALQLREEYASSGTGVLAVSAESGLGLEELRERLMGRLCCFAGQSGVGKSTLLSRLLDLQLETGGLSEKIQRGKNTTRQAELLMRRGLRVLDTAGFSLLELTKGMEPVKLKELYPEMVRLEGRCRFQPCLHDREPGCAVTAACEAG